MAAGDEFVTTDVSATEDKAVTYPGDKMIKTETLFELNCPNKKIQITK